MVNNTAEVGGQGSLQPGIGSIITTSVLDPGVGEHMHRLSFTLHTHIIDRGGDMETRPVNAYVYFIIKQ